MRLHGIGINGGRPVRFRRKTSATKPASGIDAESSCLEAAHILSGAADAKTLK